MSATRRGAIIFGVIVLALFGCVWFSFSFLPGLGVAVGLPVITVPGEAFNGALPSSPDYNVGNILGGWTNTFLAMLLTDAAVLAFALFARRATNNFTRLVPTRFGMLVELLGNFIYGQTKAFAGEKPLAVKYLFPLAATIFVFLLAANWMKLLPGIESVGVLHCAHEGFSGYPSQQVGDGAYQLYITQPLNAGVRAEHHDYEVCEHYKEDPANKPSKDTLSALADDLAAAEAALIADLNERDVEGEARDAEINALRLEYVHQVYPDAAFSLTYTELKNGIVPYIQVVTPYVRGATTDLNLTLGLALVSVFAIQVFGVASLGPGYFQKFINLNALGNLNKKPLGAVDFLVGLFEIVSEIGKIVSLAFRLFGNMFAGGILLAVMSFLIAALLPLIFIGLELIVTTIQAFVFSVLTIVFAAQAMEGHHGGDEHEEHGHDAHDESTAAAH